MDELTKLAVLLSTFDYIDLSHTIERGMPKCPPHPQIIVDPTIVHEHDGYYCQTLVMGEHTGTHVDAPAHMISEMMENTIDTYPANALLGPAIKYDMWKLSQEAGAQITADQILSLEEQMNDKAGPGDIVLMDFKWEQYWRTDSEWAYFALNAPGLAEDAVKLFAERQVKAVGSDTIACDTPAKDGCELKAYGHQVYWLPNHIFIIEMLKNLSLLPRRCYFIALPLKIWRGSGSPIRPLALVSKGDQTTAQPALNHQKR